MANHKRPTKLSIGVISSDTLRPQDLIPSLLWDLDQIHMSKSDRLQVRQLSAEFKRNPTDDDYGLDDIWQELCQIADAYVPAYCYFGSTEGDGACIGVYPSIDSLEDDVRAGQVTKVNAGDDVPAGYVMSVTDHGNVTLYYNRKELWSVV